MMQQAIQLNYAVIPIIDSMWGGKEQSLYRSLLSEWFSISKMKDEL